MFLAGILSYAIGKIWNRNRRLMRFVIFVYESLEALNRYLPIWKEVEKHMFEDVVIKVNARRGASAEFAPAN